MSDRFGACLVFTLGEEGGFSNDPNDPGGPTNYGITLATLRSYMDNPDLGLADVQAISMDTVHAIYGADYWNRMRCDALSPGVDLMVFDHGVNAGTGASGRVLQGALGFTGAEVDGLIGPVTLAAVGAANPAALITNLEATQAADYRAKRNFPQFGSAWLARLSRRTAAAQAAFLGTVSA